MASNSLSRLIPATNELTNNPSYDHHWVRAEKNHSLSCSGLRSIWSKKLAQNFGTKFVRDHKGAWLKGGFQWFLEHTCFLTAYFKITMFFPTSFPTRICPRGLGAREFFPLNLALQVVDLGVDWKGFSHGLTNLRSFRSQRKIGKIPTRMGVLGSPFFLGALGSQVPILHPIVDWFFPCFNRSA